MNSYIEFTRTIIFLGALYLLSACAGPTTPLGAIWSLTPEAARQKTILTDALKGRAFNNTASKNAAEASIPVLPLPNAGPPAHAAAALRPQSQTQPASAPATPPPHPEISFWPRHLVLHGRAPLRISVEDPTAVSLDGYRLIVRYNGADVTSSFLLRATVDQEKHAKRLLIENPSIRLSPMQEHEIEVFYISPSKTVSYARYENPRCYAFRPDEVHNLGDFGAGPRVLGTIERVTSRGGISPSFFTALIAQESGFNTRVVSWAHALGLTQITSSAEADFIDKYSGWPRYPSVGEMPVPILKAMILAGQVNSNNEWRLDVEKSIQGGVDYAILLAQRWSTPDRLARIRATFADPEEAHTELVLASYHSGYNRVLAAFERMGKDWLYSSDLREARKYVHQIESYCDFFSAPGSNPQRAAIDTSDEETGEPSG